MIQYALEQAHLPKYAVQAINSPDQALVMELLKLDRYVDMIIPRGGAGLHEFCKKRSTAFLLSWEELAYAIYS